MRANSIEHLLTHKPKNPYCEACVRNNITQALSYRGSCVNNATYWGHELTADHITSLLDSVLGITGDRDFSSTCIPP